MLKDHEVREAINTLRDIAIDYHDHQCLRQYIATVVLDLVDTERRTQVGRKTFTRADVEEWLPEHDNYVEHWQLGDEKPTYISVSGMEYK